MDAAALDEPVTADALLGGRVRLYQPVRGARMSLDPVLLAAFVSPPFGHFLDIGAGSGPLSFLLLARDASARGQAVELQPRLAELSRRGRDENGWQQRLEIVTADVRSLGDRLDGAGFDLVVTNPPYRVVGNGTASPHLERALSNVEIALTLADWLDVAARAVRTEGRVAAILPAGRAVELTEGMQRRGLSPVRSRLVHPFADRPASRILVEAVRGPARSLQIEPPLVVHVAGARYTPEVLTMLGES